MGTSLQLIVPEANEKRDIIEAYYDYVVEKLESRDAEWTPEEKSGYTDYQLTMERFDDEGEFYVYERIPSTVAEHVDWDAVRRLFTLNEEWEERTVCNHKKLTKLIELLRDAIDPLEEEQPRRNWGDNLETQAIALCEFARENDYCIELVPG